MSNTFFQGERKKF